MLINSLAGARKLLPAGSRIKLVNLVPPANNATVDLFPAFISFVLAPVSISWEKMSSEDTTLVLLAAGSGSELPDSILKGRSVLWSNKDSAYRYVLIH